LLLLLLGLTIKANAQTMEFGHVDTADLKMTECSFEKGANAMVLFDVAKVEYNFSSSIVMQRHRRIKIFNDKEVSLANVRIEFLPKFEDVKNIEAEVVNLNGDKIERTVIDPKLIYTQKIDKQTQAIIFTLPNVKPGSIIEYRYTWKTSSPFNYPDWAFQDMIPTRYSKFEGEFLYNYSFNIIKKLTQAATLDTSFTAKNITTRRWVLTNVPGFKEEAYMTAIEDNVQSVYFRPMTRYYTWIDIAKIMLADEDYGKQADTKLDGEAELIDKAKALKSDNEKIAFLFNRIKTTLKWNKIDHWYTDEGIKKAWLKKMGNSTEINLILYRFLKLAGIKASLFALGTRKNGELEVDNPSFNRLNKTVVKVPIDSLDFYVLDASGKYNVYTDIPYGLLGTNILPIEAGHLGYDLIRLKTGLASKSLVFINGQIKPDGKLEGNMQLSSSNYNRIAKLDRYDKDGEKKYIEDEFKKGNNGLEISNYKRQDMDVDSLPLIEEFNFKLDLTASDDAYIYFRPNLFTGIELNPFLNERRLSDIDFVFPKIYSINGRYKIPEGYKIDALPKNLNIAMPGNDIIFKRTVGELEGEVAVHYVIDFKRTKFSRDEYPELHAFYKKMYEMLNEQIVLKKQ